MVTVGSSDDALGITNFFAKFDVRQKMVNLFARASLLQPPGSTSKEFHGIVESNESSIHPAKSHCTLPAFSNTFRFRLFSFPAHFFLPPPSDDTIGTVH
jgi:hypothetical protein